MSEVAVARHGLILSKNGATSLGKVSKYLPCLQDAIFFPNIAKLIPGPEIPKSKETILEFRTGLYYSGIFGTVFAYVGVWGQTKNCGHAGGTP